MTSLQVLHIREGKRFRELKIEANKLSEQLLEIGRELEGLSHQGNDRWKLMTAQEQHEVVEMLKDEKDLVPGY